MPRADCRPQPAYASNAQGPGACPGRWSWPNDVEGPSSAVRQTLGEPRVPSGPGPCIPRIPSLFSGVSLDPGSFAGTCLEGTPRQRHAGTSAPARLPVHQSRNRVPGKGRVPCGSTRLGSSAPSRRTTGRGVAPTGSRGCLNPWRVRPDPVLALPRTARERKGRRPVRAGRRPVSRLELGVTSPRGRQSAISRTGRWWRVLRPGGA